MSMTRTTTDIITDRMFLPPEVTKTQNNLDEISTWTDDHIMSINVSKTNKENSVHENNADSESDMTNDGDKSDEVDVAESDNSLINDETEIIYQNFLKN